MGSFQWLLDRFSEFGNQEAFVRDGQSMSYATLLERIEAWKTRLDEEGIPGGVTVMVIGELDGETGALFLALADRGNIIVPLLPATFAKSPHFEDIAEIEWCVSFEGAAAGSVRKRSRQASHDHFAALRASESPGLVLFSSGSTGKSKAAVHNLASLSEKFKAKRSAYRTLTFLLLDHIGGINTLFYTLSNGGTVITSADRSPASVCRMIAEHRIELLPVSPTFLNLLILSGEYLKHDLSSLRLITYGTEPMLESTLKKVHEIFPSAQLQQTYGLSELGILRSKSKSSDSLWMKVGGEDYQTKIIDGILWIKARSAMLGYLNAPNPFDADGWFCTKDRVEIDGDYLKVLGREEEIINIGGEKVYPAEVESALLTIPGIRDAVVYGESHLLMGQIVVATVNVDASLPPGEVKSLLRKTLGEKLAPYKIPQKVHVVTESVFNERFKRMRLNRTAHSPESAQV